MKCCDPRYTHIPQQSLQQFKVRSDFWKSTLHRTAVPAEIKVNAVRALLACTLCTFQSAGEKRPFDFSKHFYKHVELKFLFLCPSKYDSIQKVFSNILYPSWKYFQSTHITFSKKEADRKQNPFCSMTQMAFNLKMINYHFASDIETV